MSRDMKDWIHNRAEELAEQKYNKDYYDLPNHLQDEVYNQAEADWIDHYSSEIDAAYDRLMEEQLLSQSDQG